MQSRATRFWLRFDSGPRQGETVPLAEGTLSVGRRSANKIVLADGSISGFHAELHVGPTAVEVVDLESTNGTRLAAIKIERSTVSHGDTITFGSIAATLVDREFLGSKPEAPGAGEASADPGAEQSLDRVGAQGLAAAGRRSVLAPLLLVLSLVGGGTALYFLRSHSEAGEAATEVPAVPGNLVADGSFEAQAALDWVSSDPSTEAFYADAMFARSGLQGLGVVLDPLEGEQGQGDQAPWSFCTGPALRIGSGKGLELVVQMQTGEGAIGRVGLAFSASSAELAPFVAWSRPVPSADDFIERTLTAAVPPGFDHVSVALAARGPGWVAVDDVVLLAIQSPGPLARSESLEAWGYGPQGSTLTLVRSGQTLFPSIAFGAWGPGGVRGEAGGSWSAASADGLLLLTPSGANQSATLNLSFRGAGGEQDQNGGTLSSLGPDGYRSHALDFEVPAVTDLLLGSGYDLIRLGFDRPVAAAGRQREGVLRIAVKGAASLRLSLQSSFASERALARQLASEAEAAERNGNTGAALALWQRLLDEVPFEAEVAQRAETRRALLIQAGLERVDAVRREVERAGFFGLADLFSNSLHKARAISAAYGEGEVARAADQVAEEIRAALSELGDDTGDTAAQRIAGVLEALGDGRGSKLGQHVAAALSKLQQGDGSGAFHPEHGGDHPAAGDHDQ